MQLLGTRNLLASICGGWYNNSMKFLRFFHKWMGDPVTFYRRGNRILVQLLYRVSFRDTERFIPKEGAAILICNHVSYMDGLLIDAVCPRPVRFVIDARIYETPFVHYFMSMYGAIPILPNRQSVEKALAQVSEALSCGELVCIFPEGQLTYTGNMSRFRFGVEWMLKSNQVQIVPLAIKGMWGSMLSRKYRRSKFRWLPRTIRRKVIVAAGEPIAPAMAKISYLQRRVMALKNSLTF